MASLRSQLERRAKRAQSDQPPSLPGCVIATLFFGFLLGLGLFFTFLVANEFQSSAATYTWSEQRCEILSSQVVRGSGESPYVPVVEFRAADIMEIGSPRRLRRDEPSFGTWDEAHGLLQPYREGSLASCYVSPSGEAVLERGPLWIGFWIPFCLIFVAIGAIGLFATWRPTRRDAFGDLALEPLGAKAAGPSRGRVAQVLGTVFLVVGGLMFWSFTLRPAALIWVAQDWTETRCIVEHSAVVSHRSDDSTTYSVDILYRWDRGRGVERSSRYDFFAGSSSGQADKRGIVANHPVGAEVDCWVDPEVENAAVLEPGLTSKAWIALIPFAFLIAGGVSLRVGYGSRSRDRRLRARARLGAFAFPADDPMLDCLPSFDLGSDLRGNAQGPTTLRPQTSRTTKLFGIMAATLFWNGVVSVFLHQVWQDYERGRTEVMMIVFLVPFVLVGIGFFVAVLFTLLSLRNARSILVATRAHPRLGESIDLRWRFDGRTAAIERVRITLLGREEATYQVGTNSRTATEEFHRDVLVDVGRPHSALGGSVCLHIPSDSMHSFKSSHNAIVWEISLTGEIKRWPDISETYPIVVLPRDRADKAGERRCP